MMALFRKSSLALAFLALSCLQALAHAYLIESRPGDGDLLKQQPSEIELLFNEPVELIAASLVDPKGAIASLPAGQGQQTQWRIALPEQLAQGSHLASWRVISQDGHSVSGSLVFSIGRASGGHAPEQEPTIIWSSLAAPLVMARFVLLVGLVFGIGAAVFAHVLAPISRTIPLALLGAGGLAACLSIGLQGADAHGQSLLALNDRAMWRSGLRLPQGEAAILALCACAAAASSFFARRLFARLLALTGLALAILALVMAGHPLRWTPVELMGFLSAMHVMTAIVWAGALVPLLGMLQRDDFAARLQVFSILIAPVYLILLASGIGLATTQLFGPRDLLATAWGMVLMAKLALVILATGAAAINRLRFTKPAMAGDAAALQKMRRAIRMEAILAFGILAMASFWRLTPPVTALGPPNERAFQIHLHGIEAMASMTIRPARAGPVQIRIEPKGADLAPIHVEEVELRLSLDGSNGQAILRKARRMAQPLVWEVEGVTIPAPGLWRLRVDLLIDDFTRVPLDAMISVQP